MLKQIALCLLVCRMGSHATCTGNGWEVVFSATAGSGVDIFDTWRDASARNPLNPNAGIYKSPLVEEWGYRVISRRFRGTQPTCIAVAMTSYVEEIQSHGNCVQRTSQTLCETVPCSNQRDETLDRHFFICRSYGGCGNDLGWLAVVDVGVLADCAWMNRETKPYFLYCDGNAPCNMLTASIGDRFTISVKTED